MVQVVELQVDILDHRQLTLTPTLEVVAEVVQDLYT
jgi:hypothetical protein